MMSLIKLLPPSAKVEKGSALCEGIDLLQATKKQLTDIRGSKIGMVFQDPMTSLNPFLKIGLQLAEPLIYHRGMDMKQALKRSADYLDLVGISNSAHRLNEYPHQLSGGMRQRVMIAMALLSEPELVIADEPTTALDVTIQAQIVELVKELRRKLGTSIIWITHDLSLLAGMVDRIIVMYAGFIVEEAQIVDLYKDPRHPYTKGLLASIPGRNKAGNRRLSSIGGAPPNLLKKPSSCPFAPRCAYKVERCERENPALAPIPGGDDGSTANSRHRIACWVDVRERS
jgi:oligopeptide/dipeptide ABC transporter ATP-binding protein